MPVPSVALGITGLIKCLHNHPLCIMVFSPCTALDLPSIETFKRDVQWLNICPMFTRLSKAGRTMVCSTSCNRALSASGWVPTGRFNDTLAPPRARAVIITFETLSVNRATMSPAANLAPTLGGPLLTFVDAELPFSFRPTPAVSRMSGIQLGAPGSGPEESHPSRP